VLLVGSVPPGFGRAVFFVTLKNAARALLWSWRRGAPETV